MIEPIAISNGRAPEENPLSEREMEVARLLTTGATNMEIARELIISPHTVKVHLRNIFEKLQVSSRTEASMLLLQRNWITLPGVEAHGATPAPLLAEPQPAIESLASPALAVVPAPPSDPDSLADLPMQPTLWQAGYLVGACLLCLLALMLPNLRTGAQSSPDLLTDANRPLLGKPLPVVQSRWDVRQPLPLARSRFALVLVDDTLYAMGGETATAQATDSVAVYDIRINEWRPSQRLPTPLANLAATTMGKKIYVAGGATPSEDGETPTVRKQLLLYDPKQDQWQEVGELPMALAGAELVADAKSLYLIGGWDGKIMRDEVWRYTPTKEAATISSWELLTHMSAPRAFFGAVLVDSDLYVVGGYDGLRELDQASVYSLSKNQWRDLPPLGAERSGLRLVYDGVAVFAVGGGWTQSLDTLERFDAVANVWSNSPSPIPKEWRHLGAASYNQRIHLVGGWSGDYLDVHLQYQGSFSNFLPVITND